MSSRPAIGIDLGTSNSCAALYQHGDMQVLSDDQGHRIIPSYVAFTTTQRLRGLVTKDQIGDNPTNTVYDSKRLLGHNFSDKCVQNDMKTWPFTVIDQNGRPKIQVEHKYKKLTYFPEEISAMVLGKVKQVAEEAIRQSITDAVVTVPAYFTNEQRQATKNAAEIAGLKVLRIINEPTAAALAYGLNKKENVENVLVFDLGGGTFDVSILSIVGDIFEVRATAGNTHLGGQDFDNLLLNDMKGQFKSKYNKDITNVTSTGKQATQRLRAACESVKKRLSLKKQSEIQLDSLYDGNDLYTVVTRERFETLCSDLFRDTIDIVKKCLVDAKLDRTKIHEVVLVGGSTRIPKIQQLLQEFFDGKELNKSLNVDEVVAQGAAIQAAILTGNICTEYEDLILLDVTPLSLGIMLKGDLMSTLIKRNSSIPTKNTDEYSTTSKDQTVIGIKVYEGERANISDNKFLGEFKVTGILPAPRGVEKCDVTFDIDANGILQVHAINKKTGRQNHIVISKNGDLTKEKIAEILQKAERFKDDDQQHRVRITSKISLENLVHDVKDAIENMKLSNMLEKQKVEALLAKCKETIRWISNNPDASKEQFDQKHNEIGYEWSPIKKELVSLLDSI